MYVSNGFVYCYLLKPTGRDFVLCYMPERTNIHLNSCVKDQRLAEAGQDVSKKTTASPQDNMCN